MNVSVRDVGNFVHIDISIKNTTGINYGEVKARLSTFQNQDEKLIEDQVITTPHFKNGDTHIFEFKFKEGNWHTSTQAWKASGIHPHFALSHIVE